MVAKAAVASGSRWASLPFVLAGLAPYTAGTLLAVVSGFPLRPGVYCFGLVGAAALIQAAFASREIFAPGLGRCPSWPALPSEARRLVYICLVVAALAGVCLQVFWRTGEFRPIFEGFLEAAAPR